MVLVVVAFATSFLIIQDEGMCPCVGIKGWDNMGPYWWISSFNFVNYHILISEHRCED